MSTTPDGSAAGRAGLDLEAVFNVRDLGGTTTRDGARVRPRRLLRGASLAAATARDVQVLDGAGVGVVVDLRANWERAEAGAVPSVFTVHEVPLVEDRDRDESHDVLRAGGLAGYSTWLVAHAGPRLVEVLDVIATSDRGVLVQCGAGKDRTGLVIALALDLLDVPDEAILADYTATNASLRAIGEALARTPGYGRSLQEVPREALTAPPEAMAAILAALRAAGSVADALAPHGLTPDHVVALRERLLDASGPAIDPPS